MKQMLLSMSRIQRAQRKSFAAFLSIGKNLYDHLCNKKWSCDNKAFFYSGIEDGKQELTSELDLLSKLPNSIVRTKPIMVYKGKTRWYRSDAQIATKKM